jgi:hypothetical protein
MYWSSRIGKCVGLRKAARIHFLPECIKYGSQSSAYELETTKIIVELEACNIDVKVQDRPHRSSLCPCQASDHQSPILPNEPVGPIPHDHDLLQWTPILLRRPLSLPFSIIRLVSFLLELRGASPLPSSVARPSTTMLLIRRLTQASPTPRGAG